MPAQNILALALLLVIAVAIFRRAADVSDITPVVIEPEPVREIVPVHERCMVENPDRCPERFVIERHGWRLCRGHARDMLGVA